MARLAELDRPTTVACGGLVAGLRRRKTRRGELMAVFQLEDLTGSVETLVMPALYQKEASTLEDDRALLVKGRAEVGEDRPRLIVEELTPRP